MTAKLIAEKGRLKGTTLSLETGEQWIIGRDPDVCQLLIEDPSASRKHLVCRKSPKGIILENLSDTNPVEVNDEVVKEPRLLKNGDSVKIGGGIFRFYGDGASNVTERQKEDGQNSAEGDEEQKHETIYEETSNEDKGILAEIDFDLRDAGRWLLKVIGGPNNGAEFSMQGGNSYLVGTDPTACDVVFHDTSVSRQHARITVSESDVLTLEDLKSRNGTLMDGEPVHGKQPLPPNTLITMGTTSFIVFDREGDMQTIISPLLPSIVKVLQKGEEKKEEKQGDKSAKEAADALAAKAKQEELKKRPRTWGALALFGVIASLFGLVALGTITLFQSEPIQVKEKIDYNAELDRALEPFPSVKYFFDGNSGRLLLVGHVLTSSDKNQLVYNIEGLGFVKIRDDSGLIIDEFVWSEANSILNRDSRWKGISVHSPAAGTFVLDGYLKTRKQAEELSDYITANFPYLDLLERRVFVEEDVINSAEIDLQNAGVQNVEITMANGELTLSGSLSKEQIVALDRMIQKFRKIPGVRNVKTFINETEAAQAVMNITDRYPVTGFSHQGGVNLNVVINGRILSRGDTLDGMTITSIRPTVVLLEKDGTKYKIDYNQP